MLGKPYLNKRNMREVVMQTAEQDYTIEATEVFVKTLDSTYAKVDIKQVAANATPLNTEEKTQLLRLLQYFEDLFDGTPGD